MKTIAEELILFHALPNILKLENQLQHLFTTAAHKDDKIVESSHILSLAVYIRLIFHVCFFFFLFKPSESSILGPFLA